MWIRIRFSLLSLAALLPFAACLLPNAEPAQPARPLVLVIHGGEGDLPEKVSPELEQKHKEVLEEALRRGYARLKEGKKGACLDAVETAIRVLEDSPLFNAGKGAVFTHEGRNELDAAIVEGKDKKAGAVAGVTIVKNPISAARAVMEHSPHVLLIGRGAELFAIKHKLDIVHPDYFWTEQRWKELQDALKKEERQRTPHPNPPPQGGREKENPPPQGGREKENPPPQGGREKENPPPQGGREKENPPPQGGREKENPPPQGGREKENPPPQGGREKENPPPQGGREKENPPPQGGREKENPPPQGGREKEAPSPLVGEGWGGGESPRQRHFGTVGAVALDGDGNLAAGTSTGGMTNKWSGRVGDTPIVGAGTYADNDACAVSCTGWGEYFIRYAVAHDITARVKYARSSVKEAAEAVVNGQLQKAGAEGGAIVLAPTGAFHIVYNRLAGQMSRGYITSRDETPHAAILDKPLPKREE